MIRENRPRPLCAVAGCSRLAKHKGYTKLGFRQWDKHCGLHHCIKYNMEDKGYKQHKGSCCEVCGFIPHHSCQLDVDHIDGNKANTSQDNFQTLCANCHRLKTYRAKDWVKKKAPNIK